MGLAKVIGVFFLIIILLLAVIGVDIYLTYQSIQGVDSSTLVSNPQYTNVNNETIEISVDIDLPKAGFIPKGVIITLFVDFAGTEQSSTENVKFGDQKTIKLSFTLDDSEKQALQSGSSINVSARSEIIPTVLGFKINQLKQNVDLGSTTISP